MTPVWSYAFSAATWSVGGLLVGYSLGRTERTLTWIRQRMERNDA